MDTNSGEITPTEVMHIVTRTMQKQHDRRGLGEIAGDTTPPVSAVEAVELLRNEDEECSRIWRLRLDTSKELEEWIDDVETALTYIIDNGYPLDSPED